jgi:hypothetical protein
MLQALADAARSVALVKADGTELEAEGYQRQYFNARDWVLEDRRITHPPMMFELRDPVGIIAFVDIHAADGLMHRQTLPEPFDLTAYGGSIRILPLFSTE